MKLQNYTMLFGRRVRFALIILASQLLLVALSVVMLIQMLLIAANGTVRFGENNHVILLIEIALTILIILFGIIVFILQIIRLREKRSSDESDRRR
jgi:hypothetical protein